MLLRRSPRKANFVKCNGALRLVLKQVEPPLSKEQFSPLLKQAITNCRYIETGEENAKLYTRYKCILFRLPLWKPYLKTARHRLTADIKYLYLERFPRNDRAQRLLASNRNEMTVRAISMTPFKIYPPLIEGYSAIISRKPCSTIDIEHKIARIE